MAFHLVIGFLFSAVHVFRLIDVHVFGLLYMYGLFKLTDVHVFSCMGFLLGWKCLGLQLDGLAKNVGPTEIKMDVSSFYISFYWSSFHRNESHFVKCLRLPLYFWQFWVLVWFFFPKLYIFADAHTYMLQLLRKVNNYSLDSNRSSCSYKLSK